MQHILELKHLSKSYCVDGEDLQVLNDVSLNVRQGECITIVGHSGCGKSTLLKMIAGLEGYEIGQVICAEKPVTGPGIDRGVVFQDHRLLPWLTIADNVGFGLDKLAKAERDAIATRHLRLVGLEGFENAYPAQLSGGMSQRASIARALAGNPQILLLDEPFGALDALTKISMQQELIRIRQEKNTTMVMITHDLEEAVFLGNRVIVLSQRPGRIVEEISIDLPVQRDRSSKDFSYYVSRVYRHFFHDEVPETEYTL